MMTKNTSKRKVKILSFASLPFILSAFVLFSQKSFAQEVEKKAQKVEQALEKPVQSQTQILLGQATTLRDSLLKTDQVKTATPIEKVITKDELKTILKSNPQNKIILNDAGDIILNDSIKIKDIVLKKELVPTILYGTDGKVLRKIDPKEIEKVFVRKSGDENFIEIIKKDSSIIKIFKSEKGIPNIDKKVKTAKMPTLKNNITLKNGYSIYTDKNGVEHKIISSEIDKVYLENQLKSKEIDNGYSLSFSKNKGVDKAEIEKQLKEAQARGYDITAIKTDTKNPEIQKLGSFTVKTFYSEDPKEMSKHLEEKKKELELQEKNTKKMLK